MTRVRAQAGKSSNVAVSTYGPLTLPHPTGSSCCQEASLFWLEAYSSAALDGDPLLLFQNLSAVANGLEWLGALNGPYSAFTRMDEVASLMTRHGQL